ncbi:opsin, ultraviolet-sensitive-like [Macrosteles quadrilineatus]|uniref:opsin, ultraviolet-sensitive-like n=1 Tax=Macrosteles quadrilineatus TaxID=74068 RepID=UPI0023E237A4|nr:opsin, ultraviolet-sensitive-like [Macrosteles quadrilineatus]XP_054288804.1 opsin, ultraviolet-sensitive-like [Macrosteles quadrilineatus]
MEFFDGASYNLSSPVAMARMGLGGGPRMLGWNVPTEELVHIPQHWLKYQAPEAMQHYMLGFIYVFFMIIALVGNGLVIWIFCGARNLRTPSNMFVINLALCDFMMMLKTPIFIYNSFNLGFALGQTGCQVFAIMGSLSGIGAAATNAAIAYDRYSTIARPLDGKMSRGKAFMFILCIWMYVTPWVFLPASQTWGRYAPEGYLTACSFDYLTNTDENRFFVLVLFCICYVLPMSLIVFFYSQIVSHVVNHEKALREQAKKMNVESLRSNQQQQSQSAEIRIAKAAITICFLFVASWTPYAVLALIGAFGDQSLLTPGVTMIPALTCKAVACIDPYVYAISHPRYRIELAKRLPFLAINEHAPSETVSTTTETTAANTPAE